MSHYTVPHYSSCNSSPSSPPQAVRTQKGRTTTARCQPAPLPLWRELGFAEIDGGSYRPWFYNHTAADVEVLAAKSSVWGPDLSLIAEGVQMGGSIVNYEHGLSFQTVHGSGHMVPQFRAQASLHQIAKVLLRQDFAPLLPSNATLANMTDAEYSDALDKWTISAKASPYVDPFLV